MVIIVVIAQAILCAYLCSICQPVGDWVSVLSASPRFEKISEELLTDASKMRTHKELSYLDPQDCWHLSNEFKEFMEHRETKYRLEALFDSSFSSPTGFLLSAVACVVTAYFLCSSVFEAVFCVGFNIVAHFFIYERYFKRKAAEVQHYIYQGLDIITPADIPSEMAAVALAEKKTLRRLQYEYNTAKSMRTAYLVLVAIWAFALAVAFPVQTPSNTAKSSPPSITAKQNVTPSPTPTLPSQPLPANGMQFVFSSYEALCPLTVSVDSNNSYYIYLDYVDEPYNSYDDRVLYNASNTQPEDDIAFFVRNGSTVEISVPVGVYKLYYASGDAWYGPENLFGTSTVYSTSDELLDFYTDYYSAYGNTLELWAQYDGNFETRNISANQFPG